MSKGIEVNKEQAQYIHYIQRALTANQDKEISLGKLSDWIPGHPSPKKEYSVLRTLEEMGLVDLKYGGRSDASTKVSMSYTKGKDDKVIDHFVKCPTCGMQVYETNIKKGTQLDY